MQKFWYLNYSDYFLSKILIRDVLTRFHCKLANINIKHKRKWAHMKSEIFPLKDIHWFPPPLKMHLQEIRECAAAWVHTTHGNR